MGLIDRWSRRGGGAAAQPLYDAIVRAARAPHWYLDGAVPDTLTGRFEMLATLLTFVLLRLEQMPEARQAGVDLAERFVDDMDPQLRELGIGDLVVGKHVGKLMGMLGGRLGAFRDALAQNADLDAVLVRNLYRGVDPGEAPRAHVGTRLAAFRRDLAGVTLPALLEGQLA